MNVPIGSCRLFLVVAALTPGTACPPPASDDAAVRDNASHDRASHDRASHDRALDDGAHGDAAHSDRASYDSALPDRQFRDRAPIDYGPWDSAACVGEDAQVTPSHGFCMRWPQYRDVPFTDTIPPTTMPMLDVDYLCTLDYGSLHGFAYVQARPTSCRNMGGCTATTVDGAWVSVGGVVSAVTADYNWGGNHHNETIRVSYDDKVFEYNHSSITSWARTCHPPDCTLVFAADGTALIEDGCTPARTLPQVCVQVEDDGTVPPLIDTFSPCPGDPNFQDAGTAD
ncbi:MAG: hypothetical protein JXR83_20080 [Deltaproteobacteria bacterium]|nr:hypothetical protein [Deltaproteobacteria bacterium]